MKIYILVLFLVIYSNLFSQDDTNLKSKEFQQSLTPDKIVQMLKEGNSRFMNNKMIERDFHSDVVRTSHGQYPWAVFQGCMDSRVTPEIIFDTGLGDLFVNCLAGNIITEEVIGSMEYACKVVGAKLVVVIGHSHCGAIKGAIDKVELGNLTDVLDYIKPVIDSAKFLSSNNVFTSDNSAFVDLVTSLNVRMGKDAIRSKSPILKNLEESGQIKIIGAVYDIETGLVTFLD